MNRIDKLVEILRPYAQTVKTPKELSLDSGDMWKCLIGQICVRGGSKSIDRLMKHGDMDRFLSQLSLDTMPSSYNKILKVLTDFKATRFRPSASKTIIENHRRCFHDKEFKFISLLEKSIPKKELTKERIEAERGVRGEFRKKRVFVWIFRRRNEWKQYDWKNKPISDWLKDIGFAVTLMPFDTRVKSILTELKIRLTDENYEDIEDMLIRRVCRRLGILPCQLDGIFYRKSNELVDLLRH